MEYISSCCEKSNYLINDILKPYILPQTQIPKLLQVFFVKINMLQGYPQKYDTFLTISRISSVFLI